jgi:hypothetical protein
MLILKIRIKIKKKTYLWLVQSFYQVDFI